MAEESRLEESISRVCVTTVDDITLSVESEECDPLVLMLDVLRALIYIVGTEHEIQGLE